MVPFGQCLSYGTTTIPFAIYKQMFSVSTYIFVYSNCSCRAPTHATGTDPSDRKTHSSHASGRSNVASSPDALKQTWWFYESSNGCYSIKNAATGHCLSREGAGDLAKLVQDRPGDDLLWKLEFTPTEASPGRCLLVTSFISLEPAKKVRQYWLGG